MELTESKWTAEKFERGPQVIVVISHDGESMGHLTFWKQDEELADLWLKVVEGMNTQSSSDS